MCGNMSVTNGLCDALAHALHVDALVVSSIGQTLVGTGCHKWSLSCVIVHGLHIDACGNIGVTNGL